MTTETELRESHLIGQLASYRQMHQHWKTRGKRLEAQVAMVFRLATGMDPEGYPTAWQLEEIASRLGFKLPEIHTVKVELDSDDSAQT